MQHLFDYDLVPRRLPKRFGAPAAREGATLRPSSYRGMDWNPIPAKT